MSCLGDPVAVAAGLDELLEARLVEATEDGRYRLRHALLEDTVRATLLPSRRASLHAAVAAVLAARRRGGGGRGRRPLGSGGRGHRGGDVVGRRRTSRRERVRLARGGRLVATGVGPVGLPARARAPRRRPGRRGRSAVSSASGAATTKTPSRRRSDRALADERLRDDDWSQARLLSAYAPYLGVLGPGREIAARVRAAAHYDAHRTAVRRAGDQPLQARRHPAPREPPHRDRARGQGCAAASIAAAAGSVEAQVSIGSSLAVDRVESGRSPRGSPSWSGCWRSRRPAAVATR